MITSNIKTIIGKYKLLRRDLTAMVMKEEARVMEEMLKKGFKDQVDPYGQKWDKNSDGSKFDRNGAIQKSFKISYAKNFAKIESDLEFTKYHQTGTKRLPQRKMVPDSSSGGLEHSTWQAPIHGVLSKVVERIMK